MMWWVKVRTHTRRFTWDIHLPSTRSKLTSITAPRILRYPVFPAFPTIRGKTTMMSQRTIPSVLSPLLLHLASPLCLECMLMVYVASGATSPPHVVVYFCSHLLLVSAPKEGWHLIREGKFHNMWVMCISSVLYTLHLQCTSHICE